MHYWAIRRDIIIIIYFGRYQRVRSTYECKNRICFNDYFLFVSLLPAGLIDVRQFFKNALLREFLVTARYSNRWRVIIAHTVAIKQ